MNLLVPVALVGICGHIALAPQPAEQEQHNQHEPSAHQSSPDPKKVFGRSEPEPQSGSQQGKQQESDWDKWIVWLDQHNGAITAVSTFVIAAFTVALFRATRLLWKSGEKHSERELRAYVNFASMGMSHFGAGERAEGFLVIRNCGQTPAYKVKDRCSIHIEGFPSTDVHLPQWEEFSSCMGPGGELTLQPRMDQPMTGEEEAAIRTGNKAIYISAEIRYCDAFGAERYTKHRAFHHGQIPGADIGIFQFQHTPEHHDAN